LYVVYFVDRSWMIGASSTYLLVLLLSPVIMFYLPMMQCLSFSTNCNCCNLFMPVTRSELKLLLCRVAILTVGSGVCVSGKSLIVGLQIGCFGTAFSRPRLSRAEVSDVLGVMEVVTTFRLSLDLRSYSLCILDRTVRGCQSCFGFGFKGFRGM
jgi:hypothetical protein